MDEREQTQLDMLLLCCEEQYRSWLLEYRFDWHSFGCTPKMN